MTHLQFTDADRADMSSGQAIRKGDYICITRPNGSLGDFSNDDLVSIGRAAGSLLSDREMKATLERVDRLNKEESR